MKFNLVDQIVELAPARSIRTVKMLTLAEEYLADHFRTFPVMPGVLMLECMVQSAAWLVRATEDFAHSLILLAGARNVTYKSFMTPGRSLDIEVICERYDARSSDFSGRGYCEDDEMVKAKFTLNHWNLADQNPEWESIDRRLIAHARAQFALIGGARVSLAPAL